MTHNRFEELEKRCKTLYKKQLLKIGAGVIGVGVVCVGSILSLKQTPPQEVLVSQTLSLPLSEEAQTPKPHERVEDVNETVVEVVEVEKEPEAFKEPVLFLAPHFTPKKKAKLPQKEIEAANHLLHTERVLMNHFQQMSNYENAYALAQFYFEQKAYYEAIAWTKKANKLNPNSDVTWLIYAKSKFALGEVEVAIDALERILEYIKSKELQELLDFYKGQQ